MGRTEILLIVAIYFVCLSDGQNNFDLGTFSNLLANSGGFDQFKQILAGGEQNLRPLMKIFASSGDFSSMLANLNLNNLGLGNPDIINSIVQTLGNPSNIASGGNSPSSNFLKFVSDSSLAKLFQSNVLAPSFAQSVSLKDPTKLMNSLQKANLFSAFQKSIANGSLTTESAKKQFPTTKPNCIQTKFPTNDIAGQALAGMLDSAVSNELTKCKTQATQAKNSGLANTALELFGQIFSQPGSANVANQLLGNALSTSRATCQNEAKLELCTKLQSLFEDPGCEICKLVQIAVNAEQIKTCACDNIQTLTNIGKNINSCITSIGTANLAHSLVCPGASSSTLAGSSSTTTTTTPEAVTTTDEMITKKNSKSKPKSNKGKMKGHSTPQPT